MNSTEDRSRLQISKTVLSSLKMRCELSLVLSWPSFQFATWLSIVTSFIFGNCSVSTTENCLRLSPTQFTPPTGQDETVSSCRCRRLTEQLLKPLIYCSSTADTVSLTSLYHYLHACSYAQRSGFLLSLSLCLYVRARTEKLLTRNWHNLVVICVTVNHRNE